MERFQTWEITEGLMKGKLAALTCSWLLFGCGLNTAGQGPDDDDQSPSDILAEEVEPDITEADVPETDTADDRFELAGEDASPEAPDEVSEVDVEETEDAGPEDEASEEDGETEDGETADPCTPPEIPSVGLYLWYCAPTAIDMTVMRWVDRPSGTDVVWSSAPGCNRSSTRVLFCSLTDYGAASVYYFNITTPGFDPGWSCGPGFEVTHGIPRVFWNGIELEVGVIDNGYGGCNHTFAIPILKSLLEFLTDYL